MNDEYKTFEIDFWVHEIGNQNCSSCWKGFPKKCKCGGFIHGEFGDENKDGEYWLFKICDKCRSE